MITSKRLDAMIDAQEQELKSEADGSFNLAKWIKKEKVSAAHRLLRNFNFAVNVQIMDREDDKRVFPSKFVKEIESLFDDKDSLEKIKKAL